MQLIQSIPYVDRRSCPERPGSLSLDTVAHCQGDLAGSFVRPQPLMDDSLTGRRTEPEGTRAGTSQATLPPRVPAHLYGTHSWLYQKKDNARDGTRNRRVVREHLGDVGVDDEGFVRLLKRLYHDSNLILNQLFSLYATGEQEEAGGEDSQAV